MTLPRLSFPICRMGMLTVASYGDLCTWKSKQANEVKNFENHTELCNSQLLFLLPESDDGAAYGLGIEG